MAPFLNIKTDEDSTLNPAKDQCGDRFTASAEKP